ncbi:MAG: hypothetical protein ABJF10_24115 [Chthoniobacter sp.]|uniref:hypothetical protein n=1 Tax=Chthoniobacter sp. TaxID=2510640 RepID=UPI0032A16585
MYKLPALLLFFILTISTYAAPRPIRVLILGHEDLRVHNSSAAAAVLMEKLGREAIYFDYATTPDCLNHETLSSYDALMLFANHPKIAPEQFAAPSECVESECNRCSAFPPPQTSKATERKA